MKPLSYETETLILPTDYSLGRITAYPAGERENPQLLDAREPSRYLRVQSCFLI
jgi:hypothetical protein